MGEEKKPPETMVPPTNLASSDKVEKPSMAKTEAEVKDAVPKEEEIKKVDAIKEEAKSVASGNQIGGVPLTSMPAKEKTLPSLISRNKTPTRLK